MFNRDENEMYKVLNESNVLYEDKTRHKQNKANETNKKQV